MRTFREILIELADKLDATVGKAPVTPPAKKPTTSKGFKSGKTVIGSAFIDGGNFELFVNKTSEGSYLYQKGYSHEAPIGRTKGFLSQGFITLTSNLSSVLAELSSQKEQEGGFWSNGAAPKLPVGF
jgi:hypothetical protein